MSALGVGPQATGTPWFPASPTSHRATESYLTDTISAAKPEKLANRCPLCHENFAPGEEVRARGADTVGLSSVCLVPSVSLHREEAQPRDRHAKGALLPAVPCMGPCLGAWPPSLTLGSL